MNFESIDSFGSHHRHRGYSYRRNPVLSEETLDTRSTSFNIFTLQFHNSTIMRNLPALVREKFKAAQAAGDITYFQTQLAILHCNSLPVRAQCGCASLVIRTDCYSFNCDIPQRWHINPSPTSPKIPLKSHLIRF